MPKKEFGFQVTQEPNGGWSVSLPHQCDRWSITGAAIWDEGAPHEQAVIEFAHFIVQAEKAFKHLQKGQPLNDPNDDELDADAKHSSCEEPSHAG